jgi:ABC-type branched-subunit amino acid transport system substrate-binding protein
VGKNGGKVLGHVRHPFPATDFSSFLLQAQASKAKIIGLANAGADTINSIKQASEFGIVRSGQSLAALLAFITMRDKDAVHVAVLFPASAEVQRSDHQQQAHLRFAA